MPFFFRKSVIIRSKHSSQIAPNRLSYNYCKKAHIDRISPRTCTEIYTPTVVQVRRGGVGAVDAWNPSPEFLICCSILKRFCRQCKAFDLLNKMRYILWVVALLVAILAAILDFTSIRNQVKTARNGNFLYFK